MSGKWVEIEDDFQGYLSCPETGGGPGLLLLQETFGVTKFLRAVADSYASEGYVVLVPDLFWRFPRYGPYGPFYAPCGFVWSGIG